MSDLQAIADRVEIEALRGEFTDAAMMSDHDRRRLGAELRNLPRPLPTHPDGWKFTERVYEVRYHDTTPLAGSAPASRGTR